MLDKNFAIFRNVWNGFRSRIQSVQIGLQKRQFEKWWPACTKNLLSMSLRRDHPSPCNLGVLPHRDDPCRCQNAAHCKSFRFPLGLPQRDHNWSATTSAARCPALHWACPNGSNDYFVNGGHLVQFLPTSDRVAASVRASRTESFLQQIDL